MVAHNQQRRLAWLTLLAAVTNLWTIREDEKYILGINIIYSCFKKICLPWKKKMGGGHKLSKTVFFTVWLIA